MHRHLVVWLLLEDVGTQLGDPQAVDIVLPPLADREKGDQRLVDIVLPLLADRELPHHHNFLLCLCGLPCRCIHKRD